MVRSPAIPGLREAAAQRIDAALRSAIVKNRSQPVTIGIND
jgi:hypothetical protein